MQMAYLGMIQNMYMSVVRSLYKVVYKRAPIICAEQCVLSLSPSTRLYPLNTTKPPFLQSAHLYKMAFSKKPLKAFYCQNH